MTYPAISRDLSRPLAGAYFSACISSMNLFLAVLFHMSLGSFVRMMPSVKRMSPCSVRMMGRFFVKSALMMLGCFTVVTRGGDARHGYDVLPIACGARLLSWT